MENPFKKIAIPPQDVPKELKNKVMTDVARMKLLKDITDLFSNNYTNAAKAFFEKKKNNN
ncbi:hypothetical protein [Algibacter luteus]|uniref:hypothetical protein n=1 Tax=Algibacter luteus TaxID=1178825 RepID=UPI002593E900|nr:hypothetical protein [Algibacter luteus]WJJ96955.1 hypothetical protein O5O44_00950 [Algibacter luteus]